MNMINVLVSKVNGVKPLLEFSYSLYDIGMAYIWLQLFLWQGPNMIALKSWSQKWLNKRAIMMAIGTLIWMQSQFQTGLNILAISFNRDQICLQSSKMSSREIRPEIIVTWLLADFRHCKHSWSRFEIASILGSHCYHDCKHIWSLS